MLKVHDGFSSNLSHCVNTKDRRISQFRSYTVTPSLPSSIVAPLSSLGFESPNRSTKLQDQQFIKIYTKKIWHTSRSCGHREDNMYYGLVFLIKILYLYCHILIQFLHPGSTPGSRITGNYRIS